MRLVCGKAIAALQALSGLRKAQGDAKEWPGAGSGDAVEGGMGDFLKSDDIIRSFL